MPRHNIDKSFIIEKEGYSKKPYIPKNKKGEYLGNSGVTVGSGIDLGQQTEDGLKELGVSDSIIKKIKPFLGKKGYQASQSINKNKLNLNDNEIKNLQEKIYDGNFLQYIDYYEKETGNKFLDLDKNFQTAIGSVITQYGPELGKRTPRFNKTIIDNDIKSAISELNNFGDKYKTRRKSEAKLLEDNMDNIDFQPVDDISFEPTNNKIDFQQTKDVPTFLPGYQKTEEKISSRESSLKNLIEEVKKPYEFSKESLVNPAKSPGMKSLIIGMKALAVPYERYEAAVSNVGMKMQEGEFSPKSLFQEAKKGVTGERLGQYGDIARKVNIPEPLSAAIGFFTSLKMINPITKGKAVSSAKKAEKLIKSKIPKVMDKNYVLNRAKLANSGLDDLYTSLSKEYDRVYSKVGKKQVNIKEVQNIIGDLPENIIKKISRSKLLSKTKEGDIIPDIENLKIIKGIIRRSVPSKVWSGKAIGDMNTAQLEQSYGKINKIMAEGNPALQELNKKYANFMQMRKTLSGVLYDNNGNIKANGLSRLFSKGGERGKQVFFEDFSKQWGQGKQIMKDIIKFNKRQSTKAGLKKVAPWGPALIGGGYMGSKWMNKD